MMKCSIKGLRWLKQNYPFVHFLFVPAGTTPVAQVAVASTHHNLRQLATACPHHCLMPEVPRF
ncbi:hypothetical protein HaLaN_00930 [Haematococcus lacustris]|uniref:Uncharacterized protein n=1 Tax=Haematococcus lacustris TaxID=44745 RepID=A0A699Y813_HAELA|nr:hypothetical protein HaLaN_00930 [Haematococcus lacustris]